MKLMVIVASANFQFAFIGKRFFIACDAIVSGFAVISHDVSSPVVMGNVLGMVMV